MLDQSSPDAPEQLAPPTKVRVTFIAECDSEAFSTSCTIYGLPGAAEPFLRHEFIAIVEALFGGKVRVKASAVNEVKHHTPLSPPRTTRRKRAARLLG